MKSKISQADVDAAIAKGRELLAQVTSDSSDKELIEQLIEAINLYKKLKRHYSPSSILYEIVDKLRPRGDTPENSYREFALYADCVEDIFRLTKQIAGNMYMKNLLTGSNFVKIPGFTDEDLILGCDLIFRVGIASSLICPDSIFAKFAKDESLEVRKAIADNPDTPIRILAHLTKDDSDEVRCAAISTLKERVKHL
jgi:hypothetical protein